MSGCRLRPYLLPVVAALIVLAVGVGSAIAAIPNNGTYYACFTKSTGAIKVINYPKVQCAKAQTLIKWNAKGPAGPQGVQGVQGPKGDPGPADWNAIPNIPAGFADGVDDKGVTGVKLTQVSESFQLGTEIGYNDAVSLSATCQAGKVVGGGFETAGNVDIFWSRPDGVAAWSVRAVNASSGSQTVKAYAICMTTEPAGAISTAKVKVAKKKGR